MVAAKLGGYLFDHWREAAPFIVFAGLAVLVLLWAAVVRAKMPPPVEEDAEAA